MNIVCFFYYRVKSTLHAFNNIVKHHGVTGLWKGWLPNVQRAALVNMGGKQTTNYMQCVKIRLILNLIWGAADDVALPLIICKSINF